MTTKDNFFDQVSTERSNCLAEDNCVYNFSNCTSNFPGLTKKISNHAGGIRWNFNADFPKKKKIEILASILKKSKSEGDIVDCKMLFGNNAWQSNNAITNHKKIWKHPAVIDLKKPEKIYEEYSVKNESKVKFFAIANLIEEEIHLYFDYLALEENAILIISSKYIDVRKLDGAELDKSLCLNIEIINNLIDIDCIFLSAQQVYGDRESSFIAIGSDKSLKSAWPNV